MKSQPQPAKGRVAGKIALVTGAGSGIGRATAVALSEEGAVVLCADLDGPAARETTSTIAAKGGSAHACDLDVTSEPAWLRIVDRILTEHGRLEIAVNCAGVSFARPVVDTELDEWRSVMTVNLEGVFLGTKHAIRAMRLGAGGSVVNVSSVSGIKAHGGAAAYCASKAAVIMFSKCAALECLRSQNRVRVNCVSPGGVKTPMWNKMPFFQELIAKEGGEEQAFQAMAGSKPYGRWALPEEVALAILYLASDESDFVNGTNLVFDDGDAA